MIPCAWHAKFPFIVQPKTLATSFISLDEAWWPNGLKFQPASHSSPTQWHAEGSKSHWVFSSAPSLISFYGWRHRNSWLIWMTYPRISAWIYWYKNELNSYLKSTFSPATQQKQVIFFKMSLLKLNWRKAAKFSIQRYFQLIPSSVSTWTIQCLGSLLVHLIPSSWTTSFNSASSPFLALCILLHQSLLPRSSSSLLILTSHY